MALLTGVLLGSLNVIWPWKHTLESVQNRHGEWIPVVQENVMPLTYVQLTGQNSNWPLALIACVVGLVLVLAVELMAGNAQTDV